MSAEPITRPAKYQARYIAYANAHGRTPDAMLAHDRNEWPGGHMCGFMLWIHRQWSDWRAERNYRGSVVGYEHHADFDARLKRLYPAPAERQTQQVLEL